MNENGNSRQEKCEYMRNNLIKCLWQECGSAYCGQAGVTYWYAPNILLLVMHSIVYEFGFDFQKEILEMCGLFKHALIQMLK